MTQQAEIYWSSEEKIIVKTALENAYAREVSALVEDVRQRATQLTGTEEVWQLHDFLSARRHDIDGKYDDRESFLLYTLSRLVKDGWLDLSELVGLEPGKRAKVNLLTRM
ncbi:hypothetical protein [Lyngbya confervoides]|uniref:Fluorescence recovery protein n=1 Tax=Lyngbya confervoides BDU141951 TaxID=1574623 RepID=A0ABD4TA85_9CYAN|nr:hypothetical protein [Lyngbya confervoides]MCM1985387.1 hypothetical protein [Lyngbya confervoides BDU141951]